MGQRLTSLGSRITMGVSAPIAGALGAVAKFGMDFDKAMTESLAIMDNVSTDMRKQMEETAFTVARTTKFSATEAAKAYYDLASAGLDANDSMKSMETVAQFAQAGVLDLADAGDYLAGAVTAVGDESLGTTGKVAGMAKMADILTAANNSALGTVEDFAQAMSTRAGGAMKQYGLSVEQGVASLMAFASQNIKGRKAGEQMYIALRDIQKASVKNADAWKRHGIEVYTAEGKLRGMGDIINQITAYTKGMTAEQKFAAISLLGFQDKSRGAIQALLGMGDQIVKYEGILKNAGGTTKKVADTQMEAFSNQVARMWHELEILGIKLFQDFVPIIEGQVIPALKTATEVLGKFAEWFMSLPQWVKSSTVAIAGFFAVLGPVVYAIGGLMSAGSVIAGAFSGIATIFANLGMAVSLATNYLTAGQAATVMYGRAIGSMVTFVTTRLAFLAGPWGVVAAAVITAAISLVKYKKNQDDAEASMKKNADQLMNNESKLQTVIKVYETLSKKVNKTEEDKINLKRATEELAKWTGYSAEGFERETARSNELIDSLKEQTTERYNAAAAAKAQLVLDVQDMRLQQMKSQDEADNLRRRAKAIRDGTEIIAGVGGRRATKEDRDSEFNRMIEQAEQREARIKEISAELSELGWQQKGHDIQLATPVAPPKGETEAERLERERKERERKEEEERNKNKPKKEPWQREPRTRQSLLDKHLLSLYDMSEAINLAVETGTPMELMLAEWSDELLKLDSTNKAWGLSMIGNMELVRQKAEEMDLKKAFEMFDPKSGQMTLDTQDIEYWNKIQQAQVDEKEKLVQVTRKANLELAASDKSRSELAIIAIENERKAAIENLVYKHGMNQREYDEAVEIINKKAQFEIDKVNETQGTLRARMKEQGVFTREELELTAASQKKTYDQMLKDGGYTASQMLAQWKKMTEAQRKLAPRFMDAWQDTFRGITKTVQQLIQTMGAEEGSWMGWIGNMMGAADAAWETAGAINDAFDSIMVGVEGLKYGLDGAGKLVAEGMLGLASAAVSGLSAMMTATSSGNIKKDLMGGAMSGGMAGAAVGAGIAAMMSKGMVAGGIWGAVAGAIVGIMVAYFRGKETRSIMKRVGAEWGTEISKGLAEQIKKDKKQFGDLQGATIYNMSAIVNEAGGWESNLDKVGKLRDVFVMLTTGVFDTADAAKVLNENFGEIVAAIEKTGKLAPPVISEMIRLNKEMGVNSAEVLQVLTTQTANFGAALLGVFAPLTSKFATLTEDIETAKAAMAEAQKAIDEGGGAEDQAALAKATAELNALLAKQAEGAATAGDQLARMGRLALAGFVAAESNGMGTVAALDAIGPALDTLIATYKALGLSMEGSAAAGLIEFREKVNANRELVDSAQALNDLMIAGSITGALNADTLVDMREQGIAMYDSLIGAGFTENETLRMMSGYLQNVYQAHKDLGVPMDENTARMIDQAIATGVITDETINLNSIMMEGMAAMITALGGEVPAAWDAFLNKAKKNNDTLVTDTTSTAGEITAQFADMEPVVIPYEFKQVGGDIEYPDSRPRSVEVETPDVPHLAKGGIVYGPTLALIGEREAEVVRPLRDDTHQSSTRNPMEGAGMYMDGQRVGNLMFQKHGPRILKNHRVGRR